MTERTKTARVHQFHLELVILLGLICVVLGLLGWWLRPPSTGFPDLPQGLSFNLVGGATGTGVDETLTRTSEGGAVLDLDVDPLTDPSPADNATPWTLQVTGLGSGRVCSAGQRLVHTVLNVGSDTGQIITVHIVAVQGRGQVSVNFCWSPGAAAPVALSGSYLSAQFPGFVGTGINSTYRQFYPNAGNGEDFIIQSQPQPTYEDADTWIWNGGTQPTEPLGVAAFNVSNNQHDAYRGFLSGIALGVAGAALIGLVTELLLPWSRRRDVHHAAHQSTSSPSAAPRTDTKDEVSH
jgi:hypothetical protein